MIWRRHPSEAVARNRQKAHPPLATTEGKLRRGHQAYHLHQVVANWVLEDVIALPRYRARSFVFQPRHAEAPSPPWIKVIYVDYCETKRTLRQTGAQAKAPNYRLATGKEFNAVKILSSKGPLQFYCHVSLSPLLSFWATKSRRWTLRQDVSGHARPSNKTGGHPKESRARVCSLLMWSERKGCKHGMAKVQNQWCLQRIHDKSAKAGAACH